MFVWLFIYYFFWDFFSDARNMSDDEREEKELDLTSPEVVTKYKSAAEIANSYFLSSYIYIYYYYYYYYYYFLICICM